MTPIVFVNSTCTCSMTILWLYISHTSKKHHEVTFKLSMKHSQTTIELFDDSKFTHEKKILEWIYFDYSERYSLKNFRDRWMVHWNLNGYYGNLKWNVMDVCILVWVSFETHEKLLNIHREWKNKSEKQYQKFFETFCEGP